jgi:DegV family protein with EDD domain
VVAIVADSAANLPVDVARELGIHVVPMYLTFGDEVYRDGADLTPSGFYRRLLQGGELATTSTPSVGDYLEAYERTGQREIVCVTVVGSLSASHQQARLAAKRFDGDVRVVDSLSASMAEGFVAIEAARASRAGASLDAVEARAHEVAGRTRLYATVNTFEFLRKSGRVTKLQTYAATMLDIKPVFSMVGGEIGAVARSRTKRRALARIVEESVGAAAGRPMHLALIHAAAETEAREIGERILARADVVECHLGEVTPVIGAHTGPGLVGTAFHVDPPGRG